ncbi:hypothetical protein V6172_20240, partial [Escherichia coli]
MTQSCFKISYFLGYMHDLTGRALARTIRNKCEAACNRTDLLGNDSNLLIVFYVQIMPDDFVMQLHR